MIHRKTITKYKYYMVQRLKLYLIILYDFLNYFSIHLRIEIKKSTIELTF